MWRAFAFGAMAILLGPTLNAKQRHCTFRLHLEANARDGEVFAMQVRSRFTGRPVVIERSATITENDVVAFRSYPAADRSFGVLLELDDHGRLALDTLSIERRGSSAFVFVNGRAITELHIDRRISDGKIYIRSGLASADIDLMRKDWRAIGSRK